MISTEEGADDNCHEWRGERVKEEGGGGLDIDTAVSVVTHNIPSSFLPILTESAPALTDFNF